MTSSDNTPTPRTASATKDRSAAPRRRQLLAGLAAGAAWPWLGAQAATPWPDKLVRMVVPFSPGGPTDTVARLLAEKLQGDWGQPVITDYKPGAGTILGTEQVARAPADGYTLGMAVSPLSINPAVRTDLPYDTLKDLTGVSLIAQAHFGLFANPSVPFDDIPGLIAYARANPGKLAYATPGIGTGTHLAGVMLAKMAGIELLHVPYKGSAPAQQDVIGGQVPLLFDVLFSAMPFVQDKRLKAIALASPKRAAYQPDIPLISETLPGFSAMSAIGIIGPAGIPADLLHRVSGDIAKVVRSEAMTARMTSIGLEPVGSTPEQYNASIASDIAKWRKLVTEANVKFD